MSEERGHEDRKHTADGMKTPNQKRIQDVAVYPPRTRTTTATMNPPSTLDGDVFAERTHALFGATTLVISTQIIYIMTK